MTKNLKTLHEEVSPNHYDLGIKKNLFQKYWHFRRFCEVLKMADTISGKVVDIGCHSGLFTEKIILKINPSEIYGIDISKKAIKKAKQRIKKGKFITGDAQELPFKNNYFDAAFCLEMIEHVDYPEKVMQEMYRVLKKGGYGIILIPTDNLLFKVIWFLWNLRYPVWKHVHVQSFPGNILEEMVKEKGFKIDRVKTFNFRMLKLVKMVK